MKLWFIAIAFVLAPSAAMAQSCAGDLAPNSFCANLSGSTVPATATAAPPIRFLGDVSPTGNPTSGGLLATYAPFSLQTATVKTGNREFIVNLGMTSDVGYTGDNNGDKVTLYTGAVAGTNSGDIWALNPVCILKSDLAHAINANCNETDLNNNYANYTTLSPAVYGQANTGAGSYQSTAGMAVIGQTPPITVSAVTNASGAIRLAVTSTATLLTGFRTRTLGLGGNTNNAGPYGDWTITVVDGTHIDLQGSTFTSGYTAGTISGPLWQYGFMAVLGTANEAAFYDFTGAKDSFRINGTHEVGLNASGGAFTKAAILLGNNSPLSALENDGTTIANILYLSGSPNVTQIGGGFVVDSVGGYRANGSPGVSCPSGVNATTMRVVLGIVTAC